MTHLVRHPVRWLILCCALGGLAASAGATGCSSTGYSPDCPPMVLYDVHDASAKALSARQASESAHCMTPIGHANSGTGGSTGTGGAAPTDAGGG